MKSNDVGSTLAEVAGVLGSWTTRKLMSKNSFFVACPSFEVVHKLLTLEQIHGEGLSLFVDHRDHTHEGNPNSLKFKVSASLLDLPLMC